MTTENVRMGLIDNLGIRAKRTAIRFYWLCSNSGAMPWHHPSFNVNCLFGNNIMELLNLIKQRRSVRNFIKNKPVDEKILNSILEAAIHAPSAGNVQPWHFFVIMKRDVIEKLMKAAYGQTFMLDSSCIIAVCIDTVQSSNRYGERGKNLYAIQDTSAAIQNMLLMAHNSNLGACWVGAFDPTEVTQILNLQPSLHPVALVCIGYPSKIISFGTTRKTLNSVVTWMK